MIRAPRELPTHEDFLIQCEVALYDQFKALIDEAVAAGWPKATVIDALESLAVNERPAQREVSDT